MLRQFVTALSVVAHLFLAPPAIEVVTFAPQPHAFIVRVVLTPDIRNTDVVVFVSSLQEAWTPAHAFWLEAGEDTPQVIDEWPDMEPGRYKVWATLYRGDDAGIVSNTRIVEVTP